MKKIPSLFVRDWARPENVTTAIDPACQWVLAAGARATRKWDGTACRVWGGRLWRRYDAKGGKVPPPGFEPAQEADAVTGHWPGWVRVGADPAERWHREAYADGVAFPDGTYELCGPKVGGNPERLPAHVLILHGACTLDLDLANLAGPEAYEAVRRLLVREAVEGVVWHELGGRMAKAKAKDFGLPWPRSDTAISPAARRMNEASSRG